MGEFAIVGATVIDGTGAEPRPDCTVLVGSGRIEAVGTAELRAEMPIVQAHGKFVIPGIMDANTHMIALTPDRLVTEEGRYEEAALESAAIALRSGVTTVFDTWGPLEPLVKARDLINAGGAVGSRLFVAGNIIGFSGPLSADFFSGPLAPYADIGVEPETVRRINDYFEVGVGPELLWLSAEDLRERVRAYIDSSQIDFVKYASSGHQIMEHIMFSERAQRAIVEEAHSAGLRVQAHTSTPESLRMEIDAGCDLLQHPDASGKHQIPDDTLSLIVERQIPCAAMVQTDAFLRYNTEKGLEPLTWLNDIKDINDRRLIEHGAKLLLTTDAYLTRPEHAQGPLAPMVANAVDLLTELGNGHFLWLEAVIERGMKPMDALLSATRNTAEAYGHLDELGTVEAGKRADLVILDADPLADPRNYRRISDVYKDGVRIDRSALPESPWAEVRISSSD